MGPPLLGLDRGLDRSLTHSEHRLRAGLELGAGRLKRQRPAVSKGGATLHMALLEGGATLHMTLLAAQGPGLGPGPSQQDPQSTSALWHVLQMIHLKKNVCVYIYTHTHTHIHISKFYAIFSILQVI